MMESIRLRCHQCDREDFDGIVEIPSDWTDVTFVPPLEASRQEVALSDTSRNRFEWYTHLGTSPECQTEEASDGS